MSLVVREMQDGEAETVAAMVHGLAVHIGTSFVPKLTGGNLSAAQDLVDVVVADEGGGQLIGACLGLMTFSTWRGARGLYVVDLFVLPEARGRNVGLALLRVQAQRFAARGAQFIKLEVDETNTGAERFYERLGFNKKSEDRLHILEQNAFINFISAGGKT
ncbi:GNAT family N-acetyltransferase [Aestuariivirga sp.]|uniref:GNAT family N-acetyltransferase n=1 Tax=Aestuariivirga sp. TaxID=2650926 RepID=UPI003BAAD4B0